MPLHGNVLFGKEIHRPILLILLRLIEIILETLELFYFDIISAEDVNLIFLKQKYKSLLFIPDYHHAERLLHTKQTRGMTITNLA